MPPSFAGGQACSIKGAAGRLNAGDHGPVGEQGALDQPQSPAAFWCGLTSARHLPVGESEMHSVPWVPFHKQPPPLLAPHSASTSIAAQYTSARSLCGTQVVAPCVEQQDAAANNGTQRVAKCSLFLFCITYYSSFNIIQVFKVCHIDDILAPYFLVA